MAGEANGNYSTMNLSPEIWAQVVAEVQAAAAERQMCLSAIPRSRQLSEIGKDGWYAVRKSNDSVWNEIWRVELHWDGEVVSFKNSRGGTMGPANCREFHRYEFFGPLNLPE